MPAPDNKIFAVYREGQHFAKFYSSYPDASELQKEDVVAEYIINNFSTVKEILVHTSVLYYGQEVE